MVECANCTNAHCAGQVCEPESIILDCANCLGPIREGCVPCHLRKRYMHHRKHFCGEHDGSDEHDGRSGSDSGVSDDEPPIPRKSSDKAGKTYGRLVDRGDERYQHIPHRHCWSNDKFVAYGDSRGAEQLADKAADTPNSIDPRERWRELVNEGGSQDSRSEAGAIYEKPKKIDTKFIALSKTFEEIDTKFIALRKKFEETGTEMRTTFDEIRTEMRTTFDEMQKRISCLHIITDPTGY